jgi:NAD(P)-dependent dehydrogenase (short-subunit alcohol dehydrogenase family)
MGEAGSQKVTPTPQELEAMCQLVREAMQAGAIGFASSFSPNHSGYGGIPMPSTIATEEELLALSGVMKEFDRGVFMMATGARATPEVIEKVAANSGRPAFISTVLSMYNPATPDLAITYYEKAEQARARGNEVYILSSCQPLSFDFTLEELLRHQQINYVGALHVMAATLPAMLARGSGHFSLIASVAGYRGLPKSLAYGPTKAALINLAESLYGDLQPRGIGVSLVNPGFVQTPLTAQNRFHMPALITPEQAASAMLEGWRRGAFEIHYPKRFTRWMKLLGALPYAAYLPLVVRMSKEP